MNIDVRKLSPYSVDTTLVQVILTSSLRVGIRTFAGCGVLAYRRKSLLDKNFVDLGKRLTFEWIRRKPTPCGVSPR